MFIYIYIRLNGSIAFYREPCYFQGLFIYRCSCPWGGLCHGRCWWKGCWWHCQGSHKGQSQGQCWDNLSKAPRAGTLHTYQLLAVFKANFFLTGYLKANKCTWGPGDSVSMGWGGVGTGRPAITHRAHWLARRTQGRRARREDVIEGRVLQTQPRRHSTCWKQTINPKVPDIIITAVFFSYQVCCSAPEGQ